MTNMRDKRYMKREKNWSIQIHKNLVTAVRLASRGVLSKEGARYSYTSPPTKVSQGESVKVEDYYSNKFSYDTPLLNF
jgi:hypothetical protein